MALFRKQRLRSVRHSESVRTIYGTLFEYMNHSGPYLDPFGISPKQLRERLGRRSQERRLALNQSQASVAAKAGVSVTTLKRFEAGENVSVDVLIRVAQALDAAAPLSALFPQLEARSIRDLVDENIRRQRGRRGP